MGASVLAAAVLLLLGGSAAQPDCPPGMVLVWRYADYDPTDTDPSSKPVATASCVENHQMAAAPAAADCPPGTTAVQGWVSVSEDEPVTVTTSCLPTGHTHSGTQPLVTMDLSGDLDLSLSGGAAPEPTPCVAGGVRLAPGDTDCTPW